MKQSSPLVVTMSHMWKWGQRGTSLTAAPIVSSAVILVEKGSKYDRGVEREFPFSCVASLSDCRPFFLCLYKNAADPVVDFAVFLRRAVSLPSPYTASPHFRELSIFHHSVMKHSPCLPVSSLILKKYLSSLFPTLPAQIPRLTVLPLTISQFGNHHWTDFQFCC